MLGTFMAPDVDLGSSNDRRVLAERLESLGPGEELGRLLEMIDRTHLNGHELVTLLAARARQVAHLQAEVYSDILEMALSPGGGPDDLPERTDVVDESAVEELRACLRLTRRAATSMLDLSCDLERLPMVHEAFRRGLLDLPRVRVICRETTGLEDEEATLVVERIIDRAPDMTTGQIGARLRKLCAEVDPDAALRRYQLGVADRRVEGRQNPDGTADLLGRQLPIDRVAGILARLEAAAQKLRGKDDRNLDQIRSDLLLGLLEGTGDLPSGRGRVDIRVDLTTLLELDSAAGEIPGWGPVVADLARQVVTDQQGSRWEYAITDPESGEPLATGVTRRRPTTALRRHVVARNQTCVFPGCRHPAQSAQIDHTLDYAKGGLTAVENLGPLCAHDHLTVKHQGGWILEQTRPGTFRWTSPRSHTYTTTADPP